MEPKIRQLTINDIDKVRWSGPNRHLKYLSDAINKGSEKSYFLCLEIGDEIIGYGGINFEKNKDAGYLTMFVIKDEYRNQGFGTQLFEAAHDEIRSRGLKISELAVELYNQDAKRLYERMGYKSLRIEDDSWETELPNGEITIYNTQAEIMAKDLS